LKAPLKNKDGFRGPVISAGLVRKINAAGAGKINLMEVCGTHTTAIARHGIRGLIKKNVNLISGPGCPVCVTPQNEIDDMILLCREKNAVIATFGDMLRVPGTASSLRAERERGADVRVVYSPLESLQLAEENRKKEIIFLGVGFETTAPLIAACLCDARRKRLGNYSVYCSHKLVLPAMLALLASPGVNLDGFICPGHVSAITGSEYYRPVVEKYGVPCVIAGFEPLDILQAIYMLARQAAEGRAEVEVQYKRAVTPEGNLISKKLMKAVFITADSYWRGLGKIAGSGFKLNRGYADFDAEKKFGIKSRPESKNTSCRCGAVLKGAIKPFECKLFGKKCVPDMPVGPCMVSSEGACAAYYNYGEKE